MAEVYTHSHDLFNHDQDTSAHQIPDYGNDDSRKDKRHLSLGMLVPDAIQFICAEGTALRWDESASCYEVNPCFKLKIAHNLIFGFLVSTGYQWGIV